MNLKKKKERERATFEIREIRASNHQLSETPAVVFCRGGEQAQTNPMSAATGQEWVPRDTAHGACV